VFKPFRKGRQSKRERIESLNAAHNFYAGAMPEGKAAEYRSQFVKVLPPKRERIKRPVDGAPVTPTEYQEQGAVIDWWWRVHKSYGLPVFALFSIPNGAYLASGYAGAAMLKKTGMRKGAPDLILDCARGGYHGLRIEMKRVNATESAKSDEQKEFGSYLAEAGYAFQFANGAAQAIKAIEIYMGRP
jgi:hypothetical protein